MNTAAIDSREGFSRRNFLRGMLVGALVSAFPFPLPVEAASNKEKLIHRLLHAPKLKAPTGPKMKEYVNTWKERYLNQDENYGKHIDLDLMGHLSAGWQRLTDGNDMQVVYDECLNQGVPFELLLVAIGESHWENVKSPVGAAGRWQIMPRTARGMGLRVDKKVDERNDLEKSTKKAIKFLKDLYNQTFKWDKRYGIDPETVNWHDRWAFAFWSYNRGPGLVRRDYNRCRGSTEEYMKYYENRAESHPNRLSRANARQTLNYVPKLFGIREALKELVKNPQLLEGKAVAQQESIQQKSPADVAFEKFCKQRDVERENNVKLSLHTLRDQFTELERIAEMYSNETELHSSEYIETALSVIVKTREIVQLAHEAVITKRDAADVGNADNESVLTEVGVNDHGVITIRVTINDVETEAEVVDYQVQPGDRLKDIARRLSGDPNKVSLVMRVIADLNPEIEDVNKIRRGQVIQVPGEYIVVPRVKLSELVAEYYPGVAEHDAICFLKFLNGKNHLRYQKTGSSGDMIKIGDVILVPAIR